VTADGEEVVVKLTVTADEARSEAAALAAWVHTGAVPPDRYGSCCYQTLPASIATVTCSVK
jgi:hypothetical protein